VWVTIWEPLVENFRRVMMDAVGICLFLEYTLLARCGGWGGGRDGTIRESREDVVFGKGVIPQSLIPLA